ncbi:MAG: EamA/RhaT family transporter [Flavobacteriales bacterium TMED191]|nr:MAG: EamA/RhaT family transporter [Flavobacteriales bacterium TMED191]
MTKIIFSHLALFLANSIYAINYIFAKDVMPHYLGPYGFILLRVLGACLVFSLIHYFLVKEKIQKKDLGYLVMCALFGVVINMLCFFKGLSITSPINASLIMITTPLIVYIISCILSNEERSFKRFLGVSLGLIGAGLLISNGVSLSINSLGDFLVFLNASSYALYLILIKKMMLKYHPVTVLKTIFLIGLVFIFPIGWSELSLLSSTIVPLDIILKIIFVVLFTTCGAYFLNIYAISNLRASTVAFYIYLQPLLATLLSITFGKDTLSTIKILAATFIFIGVYFVINRRVI